jgi:hypothetical protein
VTAAPVTWHARNHALVVAGIERVRDCLERHRRDGSGPQRPTADGPDPLDRLAAEITAATGVAPALSTLCAVFGLSRFERDVLLLCAAVELDGAIAPLCAAASDGRRPYPTFSLALAALDGGHWSATTPHAPLRYHRLIDLDPGDGLALGRLRIDERILHHLAGVPWLDSRLHGLLEAVPVDAEPLLADGHRDAAERLAAMWQRWRGTAVETWPAVQVCGPDAGAREQVIAHACRRAGYALLAARSADVPIGPIERDAVTRLWQREAALMPAVLMIDVDDGEGADAHRALAALTERLRGPVAISTRDPLRLRRRPALRIDLLPTTTPQQEALWRAQLGPLAGQIDGALSHIASHFYLGPAAMRSVAADVAERVAQRQTQGGDGDVATLTWEACRQQARPRLDDLAQRVEPSARWDDLVLPPDQKLLLRGVAAHVRQRAIVYEQWGFASKGTRGLGITALFSGASGTGKTLAAEVLAAELELDLYRIDLSQVVSKYIGETEKNLRRIFDAAEEGGAILLFDEADALFGKRSEVKDSHDRYANLEVSYLLQRMEAYRGLAVLTTNMRSALDTAFLRRLRFIVEFPFPGIGERTAIWRRAFPAGVPLDGVAPERLASLNITGGVIRNIALSAAFLAADAGQSVGMGHLRRAATFELQKLERSVTEAELGGWA